MNNLKYFDIHSHLNFPDYDQDREEVTKRMDEHGVGTITIGTSLETSRSGIELAEKHENIFAGIGIHPIDDENSIFNEKEFEELVKHPKVVTIGECGMDYGKSGQISDDEKRKQQELFERQIEFAAKWNKPIMIHARNSNHDILDILEIKKKEFGDSLAGNAHFFSGSIEEAKRYFDLDFSISFTGVITFAREYKEVIRYAPIENIMSETDAPFVSPIPYRGKRNEPTHIVEVVKKIAEIKGLNEVETAETLLKNAVAKFNLL
jgi:TatD DNase family protein